MPARKFKVQFTRMGEPTFNPAVLDVLEELPRRYDAPAYSLPFPPWRPFTVFPVPGSPEGYKNRLYDGGRFQMQFSLHTTDTEKRDVLIPIRKLRFEDIARFGDRFMLPGDRKITLNFIVMDGYPIDPGILKQTFDPSRFLVKLTPLSIPRFPRGPTPLKTALDPHDDRSVAPLADAIRTAGFDTIRASGIWRKTKSAATAASFSGGFFRRPQCWDVTPGRVRIALQGAASGK